MRNRRATTTNTGGDSSRRSFIAFDCLHSVPQRLPRAGKSAIRNRAGVSKPTMPHPLNKARPIKRLTFCLPSFQNRTNQRRYKPKLTVETQTDKPAVALKMALALPAVTSAPSITRGRITACTTTNAKYRTTKRRTESPSISAIFINRENNHYYHFFVF